MHGSIGFMRLQCSPNAAALHSRSCVFLKLRTQYTIRGVLFVIGTNWKHKPFPESTQQSTSSQQGFLHSSIIHSFIRIHHMSRACHHTYTVIYSTSQNGLKSQHGHVIKVCALNFYFILFNFLTDFFIYFYFL
jgi:hypothetical protein